MLKTKIIQELISTGLTVWVLYLAYFETGPWTVVILALISINLKVQGYLNAKCSENAVAIRKLTLVSPILALRFFS